MEKVYCQSFVNMLIHVLIVLVNRLARWADVQGLMVAPVVISESATTPSVNAKCVESCRKTEQLTLGLPTQPPPLSLARPTLPDGWLMFSPDLATEIGINKAIILCTVAGWVGANQRAGRNQHDGRFWTFNSDKAWQRDFFKWLHFKTVGRALDELVADGYLDVAQHARNKADKTSFYTVGKHGSQLLLWEEEKTPIIAANCGHESSSSNDSSNSRDGSAETREDRNAVAAAAKRPDRERGDDDVKNAPPPKQEPPGPVIPAMVEAIPDDIRAFYHTMGERELQARPMAAWAWGKYRAENKDNVKDRVAYARAVAMQWDGQSVPAPKSAEVDVNVSTQDDDPLEALRFMQSQLATPKSSPEWFNAACVQLEHQLDRPSFDTWARGMGFAEQRDGVIVIEAHSGIARDMLQGRYYRDVRRVFRAVLGRDDVELKFVTALEKVA